MVVTIYIPDKFYAFFEQTVDPRKAIEAAILKYVQAEVEYRKDDPYQEEELQVGK